MSLSATDKIDFVGIPERGKCVLTLADEMDWRDPDTHLSLLQAKLNTYLRFIVTGAIDQSYPVANECGKDVLIAARYPLPQRGKAFLREAQNHFLAQSVPLEWRLFDQHSA